MRLLVMFDLPTETAEDKRGYAEFRKFLVEDGYELEQFSVYSRVALSQQNAETHLGRLEKRLPHEGTVTAFLMTEKQYESRRILLDTGPPAHHVQQDVQLTLSL